MGNVLIEAQPCEPAISEMHPDILRQAALTGDSVQIANQENAQQNLWIDRWAACVALVLLQGLTHKSEVDVPINEPQQVVLWDMLFDSKVIKQ